MKKEIKTRIEIPDLDDVLGRVDEDTFEGLEEFGKQFKGARKGVRLIARDGMAAAVRGYYKMADDEVEWARFENRAKRKGLNYKPRKHPRLVYALLVALPGVKYPRIDVYASGLQLLIDEGVRPKDIPAKIKKRGGIDKLFDEAKEVDNKIEAEIKKELCVAEKLIRKARESGNSLLYAECSEELLAQALATSVYMLEIESLGTIDGETIRLKAIAIEPTEE